MSSPRSHSATPQACRTHDERGFASRPRDSGFAFRFEGFRIHSGFRVQGDERGLTSRPGVSGFGFRVSDPGFRVSGSTQGSGIRAQGDERGFVSRPRLSGFGFKVRVLGSGFCVQVLKL